MSLQLRTHLAIILQDKGILKITPKIKSFSKLEQSDAVKRYVNKFSPPLSK
jgi:hypothetical protein